MDLWRHGCGDLGLGRYVSAFHDNDIDAEVLLKLTAEDLISIGVDLGRPTGAKLARRDLAGPSAWRLPTAVVGGARPLVHRHKSTPKRRQANGDVLRCRRLDPRSRPVMTPRISAS